MPDTRAPRSWTGTTAARCMVNACGELFSTVSNFDKHKPSRRGCGDPRTMTRTKSDGTVVPVFKAVERRSGIVWVGFTDDPRFEDEA